MKIVKWGRPWEEQYPQPNQAEQQISKPPPYKHPFEKPCPFCGNADVLRYQTLDRHTHVQCKICIEEIIATSGRLPTRVEVGTEVQCRRKYCHAMTISEDGLTVGRHYAKGHQLEDERYCPGTGDMIDPDFKMGFLKVDR